jgi:PST family polysaccharide transporter
MAMALVVVGLALAVRDIGIAPAIIRTKDLSEELSSTAFWVSAAGGLVLATAVGLLAPVIAAIFGEPELTPVLAVMTLPIAVSSLSAVHQARLERELRFRPLAAAEVGSVLAGLAIGVGIALAGGGVWSLVAQALVASLVATAAIWTVSGWRPSATFHPDMARRAWSYSRGLVAFTLLNYVARNADNAIIGYASGSAALGYYSVAYRMMLVPLLTVVGVTNRVQLPILASAVADQERAWQVHRAAIVVVSVVALPTAVLIAATADRLVEVTLGSEWSPVAVLLRLLAVAGSFQVISAVVGPVYLATGATGRLARWGAVSTGAAIAAFVAGVQWGPVGVAAAYALVSAGLVYPALSLALRLIGKSASDALRIVAPIAVVAVAGGGSATALGVVLDQRAAAIVVLAAQLALGAAVFLALMAMGRPRELNEAIELIGLRRSTDLVRQL